MKLSNAILLLAGIALAGIAWFSKDPDRSGSPPPEEVTVVPLALSGELPPGHEVRRYAIEGMCCEGCTGKLYAKLDLLPEVEEAAVDVLLKRAEVVVPTDYETGRIEAALTFDKYVARRVAAN